MRISELIEALKQQQEIYGDLPVIHNIGVCYEPTYEEVDGVSLIGHNTIKTIAKPPMAIELT